MAVDARKRKQDGDEDEDLILILSSMTLLIILLRAMKMKIKIKIKMKIDIKIKMKMISTLTMAINFLNSRLAVVVAGLLSLDQVLDQGVAELLMDEKIKKPMKTEVSPSSLLSST